MVLGDPSNTPSLTLADRSLFAVSVARTMSLNPVEAPFRNAHDVTLVHRGESRGRLCVFIRCGATLPKSIAISRGSIDATVILSCYLPPSFVCHPSWWITGGGLSKFHAAGKLFESSPELLNFECFAFVDPDIEIDLHDLVALAHQGLADGCDVFQPSIAGGSDAYWGYLNQRPSGHRRPVTFVEVMSPLLSRRVVESTYRRFGESISTWGLEYLFWSVARRRGMYVYDRWAMMHRELVDLYEGPFYRHLRSLGVDPLGEKYALKEKYASDLGYREQDLPRWCPARLKPEWLIGGGLVRRAAAVASLFWGRQRPGPGGPDTATQSLLHDSGDT